METATAIRPPKVENAYAHKRTHQIMVDSSERACINCIWYEKWYREGRGNIRQLLTTSSGWCGKIGCQRGALRQPCKDFERPEYRTTKDI